MATYVARWTLLSPVGAAGVGLFVVVVVVVAGLGRLGRVPDATRPRELYDPPGGAPAVSTGPDHQPREGWRRARSIGEVLAELSVYVLVALRMIWPVSRDLMTRMVGGGDGEQWMWQGWAVAELVRDGNPIPWHLPTAVHPYGADLRLGDGHLPLAVLTGWNLLTDNPLLAYNLTVLTAIFAAMGAARVVAMEFTPNKVVWVLSAVAYASAPALYLRTFSHLNLMFAFVVPLVLREAVRVVRGTHELRPVRVALLLFLSYLSSFYYLIGSLLAVAGLLSVVAIQKRDLRWSIRLASRLVAAVALCGALMLPFLVLRFRHDRLEQQAGAPPPSVAEAVVYSADGLSFFAQPATSRFEVPGNDALIGQFGTNLLESTTFPGFALLLGLGALLVVRTSLRWPVVVTTLALWLLSLGPALRVDGRWLLTDDAGRPQYWLPFTAAHALPGLGALRAPNRMSFAMAALGLVALAAVLGRTARADRSLRAGVFGVVGVLLLGNLQSLPWTADDGTTPATRSALEQVRHLARPGETVLVVPADCQRTVAAAKLQLVHRTPEVGCPTFNAGLPWYSGLERYRSSASYAAWRCMPHRLGSAAVPFDPALSPTIHDIDGVRRDLGVRFFIYHHTYRCDAAGRNDAILQLLREQTYDLGSDSSWTVFDASRWADGTPRRSVTGHSGFDRSDDRARPPP